MGNVSELAPGDPAIVDAQRELARAEHELRALAWKRSRAGHDGPDGSEPTLGLSPTSATLERIQQDLGTTGLVQYGIVDGANLAVVVTQRRRWFVPLSDDDASSAAREASFAVRRLGRSRSAASADAAAAAAEAALGRLDRLSTNDRLRSALQDCSDVVVVPPSDMVGIPWASMPTYAERPVTVSPSATAWWVTARRRPPVGSATLAMAGPNLDHAAAEARRVAGTYLSARALVGPQATSAELTQQVGDVGTVHIAAHGHLRADSPTFSAFDLADGPFTVQDIRHLPSPVRRWVLASCDLGSSGAVSGPDLEGIVAALFSSGAGAIVAAVVEVPDRATTGLMVALHARLAAGDTTAHALHRARRELDVDDPASRAVAMAFTCFGGA